MTIDLDDMKEFWKAGAEPASDPQAIQALIKQTKKRVRWTWLMAGTELIMVAGLLVVLIDMALASGSLVAMSIFISLGAVLLVIEVFMLRVRRGLWRTTAISSRDHAKFQTEQARRGLTLAKFGAVGAPVGLAMGYIAMMLHTGSPLIDAPKMLVAAAAIVVSLVLSRVWIGRREAELQQCQQIEAELS